ncbi:ABC transporter substrate-binding protein [Variovorax sp. YR216]|uniref:ABC transporter substrate-binding protein n=1 Tax=Variovorax sp. YR216 TaxID=1882828 RepID=UPI0015A2BB02|nr:ABC transporter substrate-binding protein [Variovorax sp. YR216]
MLINGGPGVTPAMTAVRRGFEQLGYREGADIAYESRFAEGKLDRLPALAQELAARKVDVIVTFGGPSTSAAIRATKQIPIVFAIVADPVAVGFVDSLERPGGNATGITSNDPQQAGQQMELMRMLIPGLRRLAILSDADIPGADASGLAPIERGNANAAKAMGIETRVLKVRLPDPDLEASFDAMEAASAQGLLILEVPVGMVHRKRIAELAASRRLPTLFSAGSADAGGVLSYGTKVDDTWPRVPVYVDRILKGAKPGDLSVEVVTTRDLVVNLKTAREIGIAVPPDLVKMATRTVE